MAKPMVKSFTKAVKKEGFTIPGTKQNPKNFSLLTSSGLQALDTLLGGGLPIGSLLLIEEDQCNMYARILAKFFISEGILCNHRIALVSKDTDFAELLKTLPGEVKENSQVSEKIQPEMTIAWRYENLQTADMSIDGKNSFGHKLALNSLLEPSLISASDIIQCSENDLSSILRESRQRINDSKQVVRVGLLNFGSPLWEPSEIGKKIYLLRSWLRQSLAVGLVTIPSHLHQDTDVWKWIHFSDICIRLESFAGTPRATNPALKDYHGFFRIVKLPAFNSIAPHIPPSDLAFRLRRRTLLIERVSLPPEMDDTAARETTSCTTTTISDRNLEF